MSIVGFNFDKLNVEKLKKIEPPLKIKTSVALKEVKEEETGFIDKKSKMLRIPFEFALIYDPKLAILEIKGHIDYLADNKHAKDIMQKWNKEKKYEGNFSKNILNTVLLKCNIKALEISQDVNLPPHIRLPLLQSKAKE